MLFNTAKHMNVIDHLDNYSSARHFRHWRELLGRFTNPFLAKQIRDLLDDNRKIIPDVFAPRTWLAKRGWLTA